MNEKKCPVCNQIKSIDSFYTYFSKERNKYRYNCYCKPCENQKNKIKEKKYRADLKECYLASLAADSLKCSRKEIYENPELLEAYRNNLKIKRIIRENGKK